jgi:hypothetical protein
MPWYSNGSQAPQQVAMPMVLGGYFSFYKWFYLPPQVVVVLTTRNYLLGAVKKKVIEIAIKKRFNCTVEPFSNTEKI